jgi:putative SOS response-associated peptidase YedK
MITVRRAAALELEHVALRGCAAQPMRGSLQLMCGRFTNAITWRELVELYRLPEQPEVELTPRYNVAPSQDIPVCRLGEAGREIAMARWGLIPFWAKDERFGHKTINARAETVDQKPSFRNAFARRRCLIPADGFYEWQKRADGPSQPWRLYVEGSSAFSFAGLWEYNRDLDITSCTIIVTAANALVAPIHDRMPVILSPDDYATWLSLQTSLADAKALLQPYAGPMAAYPVSRAVGSPRHDDPRLIEPVEDDDREPT